MKTTFNTDAHFVIGKDHRRQSKPCQDHALSKGTEEVGIIAVADGCSSSKGHTDIGARLVTCAAVVALAECADFTGCQALRTEATAVIDRKVQSLLQSSQRMLGLESGDLQATCVYALLTAQGGLIHVLGDGAIILMHHDGRIDYYLFDWQSNRPYYPAYADRNVGNFLADHDKDGNADRGLVIRKTSLLPDGTKVDSEEAVTVREAIKGWTMNISPEVIQNELKCVVICSDGLQSFTRGKDPADQNDIVRNLTSFQTWAGEFVKRRLSRSLNDLGKEEIEPLDDISCAAIHITHIP